MKKVSVSFYWEIDSTITHAILESFIRARLEDRGITTEEGTQAQVYNLTSLEIDNVET